MHKMKHFIRIIPFLLAANDRQHCYGVNKVPRVLIAFLWQIHASRITKPVNLSVLSQIKLHICIFIGEVFCMPRNATAGKVHTAHMHTKQVSKSKRKKEEK